MTAKILVVVGTRPEGIKMAPVVRALRRSNCLQPVLVSTGQHRQMLDQTLAVFGLKPDLDLDLMRPGQTLDEVTSRAVLGMREIIQQHRPAWVLVQGDTTTAFAAALAAFYQKVPVGHVEAGLRSGERYSPFPEEINRKLIDQLSELLFAPTQQAAELLMAEGYARSQISVTGNTVVDALLTAREVARARGGGVPGLPEELLAHRRMVLVTLHRRESFGEPLEGMCHALRRIVRECPDVVLVYPVHLNPQVREPVHRLLGGEERIVLLPPVGYLDFITLMERASLILTDSGGIQEEAPTFGKPLLVLREVTERPEGVAAGVARLVGTSPTRIHEETVGLLRDPARFAAMARGHNPYGDGHSAERITHHLVARVGERDQADALAPSIPNRTTAVSLAGRRHELEETNPTV
ncbi:non-hydrolyzing UDP-N-acetylglucosamine 2-epimerase [Hyalangium versicolor]|uniref:non-hydrolyzing UDP-N-acetylglucosamine 2-epimerase n=1 Tax=Hyalangium versicolor TaxID=2861190 RepID=UPI001CCA761D|nr:UDP-N-acetylglucosamine 2-epimerase (non-hydrolyzing) [Hyalangium versicolor]